MAGTVEKKLVDLGVTLHTPTPALANYVPFVRTANFMVVSGQLCFDAAGKLVAQGQLGAAVSIEDTLEDMIVQRPIATVGLALGLGFLIGVTWRR